MRVTSPIAVWPRFACVLSLITLIFATRHAHAQRRVTVYIYDFAFSTNEPPGPIEAAVINPGDSILWVLLDDFHDTVACIGQDEYWESPIMSRNETFEYQFTIPGVYNYFCSPHGFDNGDGTATGMTSSITVLPSPGVAGPLAAAGAMAIGRRRRRIN